jgi:hypothetical protein
MNIYRQSKSNDPLALFHEMEAYLKAYYDLIDDCKEFPLWQRKIEEDLGGVVSFLGINMDEVMRDKAISISPAYARFDADK